jgi:hypothetical protein
MQRFLKGTLFLLAGLALLSALPRPAGAKVASAYYDNRRTLVLKDGTKVTLLRSLRPGRLGGGAEYLYLPTGLRLARNPDGTPQFLFLKFTTEKKETQGGTQGAIMHFLMEYGLSDEQVKEVNSLLGRTGYCSGAVPVTPDGETSTFQITSATLTDQGLTKSLVTSGKAPMVPGGRAAAAARLTANGAQLMGATFDKNTAITDLSVSFNLAYTTLVPGVDAYMRFNSTKMRESKDELTVKYKRFKETEHFLFWETYSNEEITYSEMRDQFEFMRENGIIECRITQRVDNEVTNKILQTFMQMFLDSMTQKTPISPEDALKERMGQKDNNPDPQAPAVGGNDYRLHKYKKVKSEQIVNREWKFNAQVPITETIQLTGNLKEWYSSVKDNPRCVASVNLNDPFFSHRDVRFILDLDAKEMFDEAVNYVTVNVKKRRSSGRDFEDHLTIDAKYLKENGLNYGVTYARGDDTNPEVYQYQVQWSLKGGNVYPASPPWQTGTWEGVTLVPPVRPLTIDFEASLDDLKAKDITRVTAQVHYYQFGKETETNIQISPAKGQALVPQKVFLDRDKRKYAYRLVWNHKTLGKLAGPWVGNVSDGYIYASIPEDLTTAEVFREAGKNALDGVVEKILDRFK